MDSNEVLDFQQIQVECSASVPCVINVDSRLCLCKISASSFFFIVFRIPLPLELKIFFSLNRLRDFTYPR